jgi:hypothetical protein
VIDAARPEETIAKEIREIVDKRLD